MNIDNITLYRVLNFGAKSWWAHRRLRDMGRHAEARREERRNILSDLATVRSALYILVGHGRFVIITLLTPMFPDTAKWNIPWCWPVFFGEFPAWTIPNLTAR